MRSDSDDSKESDSEDVQTVHTKSTRESLDPEGLSAFDTAVRLKLDTRYRKPFRQLRSDIRAFINAVQISKAYVPIQRLSAREYELRMRVVAVAGGSGHSLTIFDVELGTILKVIDDEASYHQTLCMSISAPLKEQKLAPILCSGHYDGRMILRDMQTGDVIIPALSNTKHHGPVSAVHVCEGERRTLTACGSQDASGRFALYMYDFQRGNYACEPKYDHSVAVTSIASVSVKMAHSFIASASIDGAVHVYEMNGKMERRYSFLDNGGAVFSIDILPGSVIGRRPSLLLAGGLDGAVRAYSLNTGEPFKGMTHAVQSWQGGAMEDKAVESGYSGVLTNSCYDGVLMRAHTGKINALAGINTVTFGCVSGGEDGYICIWNVETAVLLLRVRHPLHQAPDSLDVPLHSDQVTSVSVTLQPRLIIASGSMDQQVSLLDLSSSGVDAHKTTLKALVTKARVQGPPGKHAFALTDAIGTRSTSTAASAAYSLVSGDPKKEMGQDTRRMRKTIFNNPYGDNNPDEQNRKRITMVNQKLDAYRLKSVNERNARRKKLIGGDSEDNDEEDEDNDEDEDDEEWADQFDEGVILSPAQLMQRRASANKASKAGTRTDKEQEPNTSGGIVRISDLMSGGGKDSKGRKASGIGFGGAGLEYKSESSSSSDGDASHGGGDEEEDGRSSEEEEEEREKRKKEARRKDRDDRLERKRRDKKGKGEPRFRIKKSYGSSMPAYYAFSDKDEGKAMEARAERASKRDTIRGTINMGRK